MRREVAFMVPKCLTDFCREDAVPGQMGHCSKHGQALRRRIKKGQYDINDLAARGKVAIAPFDKWLRA